MHGFIAPVTAIAAVLAAGGCEQATEAPSAPAYTLLDESASQLRADFNRAKGSVRVLFVVDPICPGCLRGLDDVNRALLSATDDPRLQTFVVHVPVLGAQAKDIAPSTKLLQNAHVRHYWNPSGTFGRQLAAAVGLERGEALVYAWDVWLIYGPDATWDDVSPPRPERLMHQLRGLRGNTEFPYLDSEAFARETHRLLALLPASPSGK